MTSPRALRYRRLALVEQDNEKAQLLRQLADEADRDVLFTVERSRHDKIEIAEQQIGRRKKGPR